MYEINDNYNYIMYLFNFENVLHILINFNNEPETIVIIFIYWTNKNIASYYWVKIDFTWLAYKCLIIYYYTFVFELK